MRNVNKKVQLDATVCRHLFTAKSLYMFRVSQHPSSRALKTVTATSGIGHNTGTATSFQRGPKKIYICCCRSKILELRHIFERYRCAYRPITIFTLY